MQQRDRDDEHRFFSSLATTFSRAIGLIAVVIDTRGEQLPDRYAGLNFFSLPLMCFEKVWGYIICDHSKATDNSHRLAAERLLHFIVNNVTPVEGIKVIANKQPRRNSDFYYAQRPPHEIKLASVLRYIDEHLYSSYFKLHVCWLRSLTRITYWCKLIGIHSLAAVLQLELFRV
ncbi:MULTISPECIES: hypothetical protein [unclassified Raoultella]|uniref:hypothetical protein n=1 Tax=unclassified Raoultella TaxID=2627600 RepID=UPI0013597AE2|nr:MULTISPECIES: hypothetical protein [unclassified Raoultella]